MIKICKIIIKVSPPLFYFFKKKAKMEFILPNQVFSIVQGVPGKKQSHKHMYREKKTVKPKQGKQRKKTLTNAQHSEQTKPPSMVIEGEI
jgi:hypothetical protein